MSYKFGLNGNDLNWDFLVSGGFGVKEVCVDCEHNRKFLRLTPEQMEMMECEGHTHKYSSRGWSILHDTNGNFAKANGFVPLEAYTSEYLADWMKDEYIKESLLKRIWAVLKEREYYPHPIGVWSVSNNTSFNVYEIDDRSDRMLAGISGLCPQWFEIETEEVTEDNEGYANGDETLQYIQRGETKWYINECMKV